MANPDPPRRPLAEVVVSLSLSLSLAANISKLKSYPAVDRFSASLTTYYDACEPMECETFEQGYE